MLNIAFPHVNFRATIARLFGQTIHGSGSTPDQTTDGATKIDPGPLPIVMKHNHQWLKQEHVTKQEIPAAPGTPLEWLRGLPRDMSLVMYIDQPTTQIMEMLAVSRRQAADLFRVPMYARTDTRWQALGPHRMRRMEFTQAQVFQDQEDSLTELEGLLSARWYTSTELSNLDQAILRAFEASCAPGGAPVIGLPAAPDAITQLRELLQSRAVMSEEAKRIDETLISAFQKIGVALPDPSHPAG